MKIWLENLIEKLQNANILRNKREVKFVGREL